MNRSGIRRISLPAFRAMSLAKALALAACFALPAKAQDTGRTVWEGFHVGAHLGLADNDYGVGQTGAGFPLVTTNDDGDGAIGGIVYGNSWQFNQWVIGSDSDFSWSDADSGQSTTGIVNLGVPAVPVLGGPFNASVDVDYSSSSRLRAGRLVSPNTLVYGTVGVAFAKLDVTGNLVAGGGDDKTAVGVVFGGGVETTLGSRWFARLEYLHSEYGTEKFRDVNGGTFDVDLDSDVVRGAVGYRFDWSPLDLFN